ncbi:TPA: restriction endonuclease subunit S [Vibrio cholerae]|uniref:restriction endonuclease subunit S n=1 Tax=Vibrio cholerae TaxID=666 RepID=UPI001C302FD1|nr:restriction endonuclease subunit S [Vibrio cholerae]
MDHELGLKSKPDDWKLTTLGEYLDSTGGSIQTGPFGSQLHASDYVEVGTPSVMPKNISVEGINTDDIAKVSNEDMLRLSKYHLEPGDIVYSRRGDVEKCALVKEQEAGWLCGTGCLRVRLGNSDSVVSAEFLHSYLSSPMVREWISRNAVGATMPNLNTGILRDVPLLLPSVSEANVIGRSWAALNKKITLNRQINQTLEQMAQTLFKSWFVDFDPVIDNALDAGNPIPDELKHRAEARKTVRESEGFKPLPEDVRQLFPDAFEESELGWVPNGWGVAALSTLAEVIMGQSPKGDTYNDDGIGTALVNGPVEFGEYHPVKTKWTSAPSKFSQPSDLIVCVRGSTTGRYVISDDIYCLGRGVCSIRGGHIQPFITYLFKQQIPALLGMATGSTFPSWSGPTLKNRKVIKPTSDVISRYCEIVGTNLQKMALLDSEIQSLKNLRDTLLPKLISGELRLDEIELAVEEEAVSA